ncbi:MAG: biotin--[acetyl-CoA-carboxylase] ligase [Granulosicoccus sp.]|nr:biotin--[acetyl-CoA-carboxylase] ligase [Granulosicoccus sp.]
MTLDAELIRQGIAEMTSTACHIDIFDELDSTNKHLARQLAAEPSLALPRLCVAVHQSAGVGRRGRVWHSPISSITLSLIQRFEKPSSALMGLSLVTGIALAELLKRQVAQDKSAELSVKWPNDILAGDRKLGGILIEVPQTSASNCTVITGIGINLSQGEELLQVDQPYAVLESLLNRLPEQSQLTGNIAGAVLRSYEEFEQSGWQNFADRWAAVDYLHGKAVTVSQTAIGDRASEPVSGIAKGVAIDGGLMVQHAEQQKIWYSGEISVRADLN